jgi:hypothetical protein
MLSVQSTLSNEGQSLRVQGGNALTAVPLPSVQKLEGTNINAFPYIHNNLEPR